MPTWRFRLFWIATPQLVLIAAAEFLYEGTLGSAICYALMNGVLCLVLGFVPVAGRLAACGSVFLALLTAMLFLQMDYMYIRGHEHIFDVDGSGNLKQTKTNPQP
jgi:hypothetical protein